MTDDKIITSMAEAIIRNETWRENMRRLREEQKYQRRVRTQAKLDMKS